MQKQTERHLLWDGCYNARDLGGLPLGEGGETRWGAMVRADLLGRLTEQGRRAMLDYGVRTLIDLRSPQQAAEEPSAYTTESARNVGLTYLNLPVEAYYPHVSALISRAQTRAEVYCITLDHYPAHLAAILRAIAGAEPGGVVIHCHAGKDRTGVVTGLLLGLAGVPEEEIAADYAESQVRLWPLYETLIAEAGGEEHVDFWLRPTATAEMMFTMLAHLRRKYGGIGGYLRWAGLSERELGQLCWRLTK